MLLGWPKARLAQVLIKILQSFPLSIRVKSKDSKALFNQIENNMLIDVASKSQITMATAIDYSWQVLPFALGNKKSIEIA